MTKRNALWLKASHLRAENVLLSRELKEFSEVDLPDRQSALEVVTDSFAVPARQGAE